MEENTTTLVCRIDPNLKAAFDRVAKSKDQTTSQMIRAYIRREVENHNKTNAQKDLFKPSEAPKPESQPKASKKAKKPPLESREGLLGMFKRK